MSNKKITSPRKIEQVKSFLKKVRYPTYSKLEEEFEILKRELKLPPSIIFRHPAYFENNQFSLEFSFKDEKELKKALEFIQLKIDDSKFKKLEFLG